MSADPQAEAGGWLEARSERVVETALARVFLTPDAAFKQKRAVRFDYVDFTTPAQRFAALARELEFNRATAPDIYRAIRRITRAPDGGLEFDGPGEELERVLEMRRFADDAVLAANPDALDGAMAEALGRTIARMHAEAPRRTGSGLAYTVPSNASVLRALATELGEAAVEALIVATEAEYARRRPLLEARAQAGFSRRCHGDLHLGNILVEQGRPVPFDCIEFNDALSDIDVLYDLGFLLMDLDFRGRRAAAVRVLSGYLDEAARRFPETLWAGLAALPLVLSVRAAVRAHVCAHSGEAALGRRYLAAAQAHLAPARPVLAAVGGLSGSGKSSLARRIAPALGAAPGAVILRSDEIRKRQAGVGPTDPAPRSAYSAPADAAVFAALFDTAEILLKAGRAVVLDATFMRPELRRRAEAAAQAAGVAFHGLWLDAPAAVLEARVAARSGDASDADVAVLRSQLTRDLGAMDWRVLDASSPIETTAEAWLSEISR
ncbi:AAA family ATPase [Phenylobacterium sp. LjRoot219]|uniref:bifunctional aminoglycoside phosphotransferase/ATP-binding protein n=1 Tax=Phenylobacterium sp. LjRoot219 TaxID=3342283 RepID=UPI003ED07259